MLSESLRELAVVRILLLNCFSAEAATGSDAVIPLGTHHSVFTYGCMDFSQASTSQ